MIHYLMIDVHYYIPPRPFKMPGTLYISGTNFSKIPGKYLLPTKEGSYQIYLNRISEEDYINKKKMWLLRALSLLHITIPTIASFSK